MRPTASTLLATLVFGAGLAAATPATAQPACAECHGDAEMFDDPRLLVTEETLADSIHGQLGLACTDCHTDLAGAEMPHAAPLAVVDCGLCHGDAQAEYAESVHGYARERGNPRAPSCSSCHGDHDIGPSSDLASSSHRLKVQATCAGCHGNAGLLTEQLVRLPDSVTSYARSVHGQGADGGGGTAASCVDCHSAHRVRSPEDPESSVHPTRVAATCGECHSAIFEEYSASIHGRARQAGIGDSPLCTNCHGEHLILAPTDPEAGIHSSRLAQETCARCHDDPVIVAKYSLEGGVVGSYVDSFHGWATRRNDARAASCTSCHTAHRVLPKDDPASSVHPDNVAATCRGCHPRADIRFAASYDHRTASITANPINRALRSLYRWLIGLVIGGMVLHNLLIMSYFLMERRRRNRAAQSLVRLDRWQIAQHLATVVAFTMLVITGFALRFPEAWWVRWLSVLGLGEPARALLHRVFSVVLIAVSLGHLVYILGNRRGAREFSAMLPRSRDLTDAVENVRFHLRWRLRPVSFGRYDYTQKAEYWALLWGTLLMAFTGLVLWFPELAVKAFPTWIVTASQTVHYYEAWLAFLAIVVWHLFFVLLHPSVYPMSWTWLTGRMSLDEVEHHHREWYDEERAARERAAREEREREAGSPAGPSRGSDPPA